MLQCRNNSIDKKCTFQNPPSSSPSAESCVEFGFPVRVYTKEEIYTDMRDHILKLDQLLLDKDILASISLHGALKLISIISFHTYLSLRWCHIYSRSLMKRY